MIVTKKFFELQTIELKSEFSKVARNIIDTQKSILGLHTHNKQKMKFKKWYQSIKNIKYPKLI